MNQINRFIFAVCLITLNLHVANSRADDGDNDSPAPAASGVCDEVSCDAVIDPTPLPTETPAGNPLGHVDVKGWDDCRQDSIDNPEVYNKCKWISEYDEMKYEDRGLAEAIWCQGLFSHQRFEEAKQHCTKAIKFDPNNALAYQYLGALDLNSKDYTSALDNFNKAIKYDSISMTSTEYPMPSFLNKDYLGRGLAHEHLGESWQAYNDYVKAGSTYKDAIPLPAETSAQIFKFRGRTSEALGNRNQAIEDYKRAMAGGNATAQGEINRVQAQPAPQVSDSCIELHQPVPSGIGCGKGKQWFWTQATIKKAYNCPNSVSIEYFDPGENKLDTFELPGKLQTCGEGVSVARVRQP